jgi:hypothetical protein
MRYPIPGLWDLGDLKYSEHLRRKFGDADKADGLHEILRWKSLTVFLVIDGNQSVVC